jgi:transcription elongation factor GreA
MSLNDYITIEGYARLKERLRHLNHIERPEIVRQVVVAREMGDLSENAEYHAAREKQRQIDKEIGYIRKKLDTLKVIDPEQMPKDAIRFGAMVTIKDLENEEVTKYRLVGVDELCDPCDGIVTISIASPIGRSLLGKKQSDVVRVKTPLKERKFKVIRIK